MFRKKYVSFSIALLTIINAAAQITDKYIGGAQKGNTAKDTLDFPPLPVAIYKTGWIDFNRNGKKDIYEDPAQPVQKRVEDLLKQMNLNEKTCQLATLYGYGAVLKDRLPKAYWRDSIWKDGIANIDEQLTGLRTDTLFAYPYADHAKAINIIQRWFIENTRLGIPVDFTGEGIRGLNHMKATYYPSQLAQACTFNKQLVRKIGEVTGREAKALGYTNIYSPILDVATDPRWGRIEETYGSDPYLVGTLGVQNAQGLQSQGIASTAKHFALYSIPFAGSDGWVRTHPMVAMREAESKYLEPFRRVIKEANVMGVMVSYNDYDGIPIMASQFFLTDILRKKFGFNGYTVSDSHAVEDLIEKYAVTDSEEGAVTIALKAGLNVRTNFNSPSYFILAVRKAVADGKIAQALLDERVREVLEVKFRLGLFNKPYVPEEKADEIVHNEEARQLALEAAHQSIVLLKNKNGLLPLDANKYKKIAVIGPNAMEQKSMISRYGPVRINVETIYDGIKNAFPHNEISYALGCTHTDPNFPKSDVTDFPLTEEENKLMDEAVSTANQADIIIVSVGDNNKTVGESASRLNIKLPGRQDLLIEKLTATGKPVVIIHTGGRPASFVNAAETAPAIIENFYGGEYNAQALGDVLNGTYNPSGKLPVGILKTVGQVPLAFPMMPADAAGGNAAITGFLYPFGFGLSYTSFEYSRLNIDASAYPVTKKVKVTFAVKNMGNKTGDEVAQIYIRDNISSVVTYNKELCGYERISLQPGETKTVTGYIEQRSLSFLNDKMQWVVEPGTFTVSVGASSEDTRLKSTFDIK